ncbi:MAG TPA: circularly permuted type 2 ATP-grasp protein [Vicinamibacteria bacterium]|nr:circularly permuted type 2 ATP-grasp protein [Vicinamibacteria bacterium]
MVAPEPASPAEEYNRLLAADPGGAAEQAAWLAEAFTRAGVTFEGAPMRTFLRPHLVPRAAWERLREDGRRLLALAVGVARRAFAGDALALGAYLGLPDAHARWIALDPGPPDVLLSRLDAFLTPGGPRFLEVNNDAPAGFGYADAMAGVFRQLPAFQKFAAARRVSYPPSAPALVGAVLAAAPRGGSGIVAIVDWAEVKTRADQELLRRAFEAAGRRCRLVDPREMVVRHGRLWAGTDPVDLVYRRALLGELVARADEAQAFLHAYRERVAVFVNSFRCQFSEDKALFSLLTDERHAGLLAPDERALVARVVPWTRKVEERRTLKDGREMDLVAYVVEQRAGLVLKPAHGYGGESVVVGEEVDAAAWEAAVRAAVGGPWVVQERVPIPAEEFPTCEAGELAFARLNVNANPFYVQGAEAGGVCRASRNSVINVSAGGGSVPMFVVD